MIIWLERAQQNLANELSFIDHEERRVAKRIARHVKERVESLLDSPHRGREGRIAGTRELVFSQIPYILVYRICGERVEILRFFHAIRKFPKKDM